MHEWVNGLYFPGGIFIFESLAYIEFYEQAILLLKLTCNCDFDNRFLSGGHEVEEI